MTSFASLRVRLVGTVFVAIAPALALTYIFALPWTGFMVGLLALVAAWFGGERYVLRQVRVLLAATRRLAGGDLSSRTGVGVADSELGELARTFDTMAESLQQHVREREETERTLLNRALQQTVVAALGQFALISNDFVALLNQAVMLVSQTLEVEYCQVLELLPGGERLLLRAGVGWKPGCVGNAIVDAGGGSQARFALAKGEPVVIADLRTEARFRASSLLMEHNVVSGASMAIATRQQPFGVLSAYTAQSRTFTGDELHFLLAVATVLAMAAERKRAEAEMQKLAAFAQLYPNPALELDADGLITYFNDASLRLALSVQQDHPRGVLPPDIQHIVQTCLQTGQSQSRQETRLAGRTLAWSFHPVTASQVVHAYVEDVTDRLNLEAQLRQAQKMESIGQLAAGVAHDFNNMLTIIQGHSGMLLARPELPPGAFDSVQAIGFAAERAAGLTRQLLMFSRKNVMQVAQLDLREVVGTMGRMLKRLLGETITLEFSPPPDLPLIEGDAGMLEQVVMNLSVNARDAMPKGGTLRVSVDCVEIAESYVQTHPEARVGRFVRLQIADSGCGMDGPTLDRIFEPFFTTKDVGKGTGLGLATVYGIVKQHGGWIEVESAVGQGSLFAVFFPTSPETAKSRKEGTDPTAFIRGGDETILIVEDEPVLRDMAQTILKECGYRILEAANGKEAMRVWEQHAPAIDLLLTDMVMPEGMSGVELAEQVLARHPRLKIIFASGYTVDEVSTAFLKKNNARFLQKPYTRTTLARTVRQALDGTAPQPAGTISPP